MIDCSYASVKLVNQFKKNKTEKEKKGKKIEKQVSSATILPYIFLLFNTFPNYNPGIYRHKTI